MITSPETGWTEATILINGKQLNFAEAMSLRVAFRMQLASVEYRRDLGPVATGYDYHLQEIERKLFER